MYVLSYSLRNRDVKGPWERQPSCIHRV
jgi:hypothetical protein